LTPPVIMWIWMNFLHLTIRINLN